MVLTQDNITLRPLELGDISELAALANNKNIWNNVRDQMPHPYSEKDAMRFVDLKMHQEQDYVFAIVFKGKFSGMVGLHPQKDIYRLSAELGYWIGEPYWGNGLASKAVDMIVKFGFDELKLNRIFAGVFEHNDASKRVLEKNGFIKEGVSIKAAIKNGVILDEWRYGITTDVQK
jgi:RimJ/RimL family protein N-acetyltransferase